MATLKSNQKAEIVIQTIKGLNDLDLENVENAIKNEKRAREKKSGNNGTFTSTETL